MDAAKRVSMPASRRQWLIAARCAIRVSAAAFETGQEHRRKFDRLRRAAQSILSMKCSCCRCGQPCQHCFLTSEQIVYVEGQRARRSHRCRSRLLGPAL